jgi:taurine dioxygenase
MITITPGEASCGAEVTGLDLSTPLSPQRVEELRRAWLTHHVLVFPGQNLSDDDLERFTLAFGGFGDDPFIAPIPGRRHILAVRREADETSPIFAEAFHTDWSFQERPPAGTCLYSIVIPPVGGDTLFANQHLALERMPDHLRSRIEGRTAIHSARRGYAPDGLYGQSDHPSRSMSIRPSERAFETQRHLLIQAHPETGREGLYGCFGYIIGIEGMADEEAYPLLLELYKWQTREEFVYRHSWTTGMLVMWDNRSLLHAATGGYSGHSRRLHRTTIAAFNPN